MNIRLLFIPVLFLTFSLQGQDPTINWVQKNGPLGGQIIDLEVDASTGKVFLLDGDYRPYVSQDGGESWQKITLPDQPWFNDIEIADGTIFLVGSYELYASTDGGQNFQQRMTGATYSDARKLKRMPVSGNLVVLTHNGSIYTSANNGQSWTLKSTQSGVDQGYHLAVNLVDQIFILKQNGLFEVRPFRSNDGGASFTERSSGIPAGQHAHSISADNAGENIYCVTTIGLYASTDGASWSSIKTGSLTDPDVSDVFPGNSFIEFSADGLGMFFVDNVNHKLHAKTLEATDWVLRSTDFPSGTLKAGCAAAKDYPGPTSATAYFGTSSGVFKTITGGASVSGKNVGIASVRAEQILSHNNYYNLYIRTEQSELLKSEDKGNTWTKVSGLTTVIKNFSSTEGALFVLDVETVLKRSYNHGSNWYPLIPPSGGFVWASGVGDSKVFGLANTGAPLSLYYSSDNGETWTATPVVVSGMPSSFGIYEQTIRFVSPDEMVMELYDGDNFRDTYYRISFTYNASEAITAATASEITTIPIPADDIYKVASANGRIYVYQAYGTSSDRIAVSEDGGVSWATHAVPESNEFFVVDNGYIFLSDTGNPGKLYISRDHGATFAETTVPAAMNVYDLRDITLDNDGYAYLAFDGDYLYQSDQTIVPPAPPINLQEIGHSAKAVALRWDDENNYERDIIVERSLNGSDFDPIGQQDGWEICYGTENRGYFIDPTVLPGITYTYRIKAKNAAGESAPTSTVMVTTLAECVPDLPENRSWQAINAGAGGYAVLGAPVNVGVKHLGEGKYEISDLSLGLTGSAESSSFYVACSETMVGETNDLNPDGNGTWNSATETLTLRWRACNGDNTETITLTLNPADPAPAKPAALFAYVVSNSEVEVNWRSGFYEKSYVLERSESPSFTTYAEIAAVDYPEASFIDNTGLVEGTTYYYRIKSLNGNLTPDASPYSDIVSVLFTKPNFVVADNAITDFKASASLGSIWADFNNDGFEDYLTMQYDAENEMAAPVIFKNVGNGVFESIVPDLGDASYFWPSVADFDNDNHPDLALGGNNARVLDIFRGNGDFTFTKVPSGQLGDLSFIANEVSATSWADIDNDGLLDLLVTNAEDGSFLLYKQNENHSFTDVFASAPSEDEPLLSIWADYDNDGYQDVLIGNLDGAGGLYKNNGDLSFTLITGNGLDAANYFSAAWGDYNNDGNIDLFCGNSGGNALYKNNGDGTFTKDLSTSITEPNLTIAASWGDFNNDGFLDLFTAGFASTQSRLFIRDPSNPSTVVFKRIITEKINDRSVSHYSVAGADPDRNGLIDLALSAFVFNDDDGDELLPTNNNLYQNNNLPGNWSQVKLVPVTGNREAIGARITLNAGGRTLTREIASASSLLSRNSTIAHFGLGSATTITNVQVRWQNGTVQNYPFPPSNQILVIDEDVQGPTIVTVTPANNATDISTTTPLTITLNENNLPVPGKKLYLTKAGEGSPFTTIDVADAAKAANEYTFTLPVELDGDTEYHVTLDAGAFRDRYANPSSAIGPAAWKFTTVQVADAESPAITFTVPASPAKGFGSLSPEITVTDNIEVSTVVVSIRKISGTTYTDVAATVSGTNTYAVQILEAAHFDATGAEFFITATDLAGNSKRHPEGTNTHKVYLTYNEDQSSIPTLGFGGLKNSWKVFSIPFVLNNPDNQINIIFDELEGLDSKKDYRMISLNDARDNWKEYPSFTTIDRGQGYFINIKDVKTIKLPGTLTAPANSRENLFQVTLQPGWNMVGNPYLTPISWADVSTLNGLTGTTAQFKKYSAGTYSNNQNIAAYEGGFVFSALAAPVTIDIPFLGQTASGGRIGSDGLGSDLSANAWVLPLKIRNDEITYDLSGIGMAPGAHLSMDDYDDVTPPRFFDYLEINFNHPEHFARRFTRDIVPTQQDYAWDFTVDTNLEGMAELSWDNVPLQRTGKDLLLLDINGQKLINMKENASYTFSPKDGMNFRIYFGENLNITPERVHLGRAFPNPTDGHTTIAFSLPEIGGLNQSVSLEILDAVGRNTATLTQESLHPGFHEATFDARGMTRGFYTYRLTVKNNVGQTIEVSKLIIK